MVSLVEDKKTMDVLIKFNFYYNDKINKNGQVQFEESLKGCQLCG